MIEVIEKTNEKVRFKLNMSLSLANALRRSVNYIPVLAIDSLEISKNDSALYDEIIAHRMGLVPLKNEKLKLPEDCDCGKEEGCGKCSIKFKLSAIGPSMVYSDQLSPKGNVIYKMPVTLLEKDQELEFVAIAKMGIGVKHAKYSPGAIYYKYEEDSLDGNEENFKKLIEDSKKDKEKDIIISIESWGQMSPKEIFSGAVEILNKEIREFIKKMK